MKEEWNVFVEGMNYSCSLTKEHFCFGASSGNPHGEWGSSCSLKEFIDGKHQDFVKHYFPEKWESILAMAEKLYRK